jgi:hypothetical protein
MAYEIGSSLDLTGDQPNLWGGIFRAFSLIDPALEPAIFVVEAEVAMATEVHVMSQTGNDHGNSFATTSTAEPASMQHLFDLLNSFRLPKQISEKDILSFVNAFERNSADSPWSFVVYDKSQSEYLFLRFKKTAWAQYCPPSPRESSSFLQSVAEVALNIYSRRYEGEYPQTREFLLTEREILLRGAWRMARVHAEEIGLDRFSWSHLLTNLTQCSLLGYEQRTLGGCLLLAAPDVVQPTIRFLDPIPLAVFRLCRKALEMSQVACPLVSDGNKIFGLISRQDVERLDGLFSEIRFLSRHWWQWLFRGRIILEVRDGVPLLPKASSRHVSLDAGLSSWRQLKPTALDRIRHIVDVAASARHGALIVISEDAAGEATRLGTEAIRLAPSAATGDAVLALTSVDGAVLLDLEGQAHGAGIIVDGPACPLGNPARGSRFNSAVRYLMSSAPNAVAVVVSSDGTLDILDRRLLRMRLEELTERRGSNQ